MITLSNWIIIACLAGAGYWGMSFAISEYRGMRQSRQRPTPDGAAKIPPGQGESADPDDQSG